MRTKPSDAVLDFIVDIFDMLFRGSEFAIANSIIEIVDVNVQSSDMLVTLLTITAVAKSHLPARDKFVINVEIELRKRNEWTDDLLTGLY